MVDISMWCFEHPIKTILIFAVFLMVVVGIVAFFEPEVLTLNWSDLK